MPNQVHGAYFTPCPVPSCLAYEPNSNYGEYAQPFRHIMYKRTPAHAPSLPRQCSIEPSKFSAEMAIHSPGLKNIDKPVLWVFPELVICLDCGTAEFAVPEAELCQLAKGDAAAAG